MPAQAAARAGEAGAGRLLGRLDTARLTLVHPQVRVLA